MEHQDLWIVVSQLLSKINLWVTHVNSHTNIQDFDHIGNEAVDKLVQSRAIIKGSIIFPSSWKDSKGKISIPVTEQMDYLTKLHSDLLHVGNERTRRWLVDNNVEVSNLLKIIPAVRNNCSICMEKKSLPPVNYGEGRIQETTPGVSASMDVGHLPDGYGPYRKFLVIADNFGGHTRVYPIKRETAKVAKEKVMEYLLSNRIKSIRSDNATMFTSLHFRSFLEKEGIEHVLSIPYQSNTNGVAERAVRSVKQQVVPFKHQWHLPENLYIINTQLSLPKLRQPVPPAKDSFVSLQVGDEVWIKSTQQPTTVTSVEGNRITCQDGAVYHPKQLWVKKRNS